jgi:hypothetical protein
MKAPIIHWRWFALLLLFATLTARSLPLVSIVVLACGAVLAIRTGLGCWGRGPFVAGRPKETYWRGRRIDSPVRPTPHRITIERPPLVAIFYFAAGGILATAAFLAVAALQ